MLRDSGRFSRNHPRAAKLARGIRKSNASPPRAEINRTNQIRKLPCVHGRVFLTLRNHWYNKNSEKGPHKYQSKSPRWSKHSLRLNGVLGIEFSLIVSGVVIVWASCPILQDNRTIWCVKPKSCYWPWCWTEHDGEKQHQRQLGEICFTIALASPCHLQERFFL